MGFEISLLLFLGYIGVVSFLGYRNSYTKLSKDNERRFGERRKESRWIGLGRRINNFNSNSGCNEKWNQEERRSGKKDRWHRKRRHLNN